MHLTIFLWQDIISVFSDSVIKLHVSSKGSGTVDLANEKRQVGIRIPLELDKQLEAHVKKIGISRAAFILGLVYKELNKDPSIQNTPSSKET